MGLLDKVKDKLNAQSSSSSTSSDHPFPAPPPVQPLGPDLIPRYRKQRGVNLGSWFVLEKWIAPGPFRNAASPGESDLDIAKGRDAKAILEQHWDSWIKDEDWRWIKERGYNSVRIPVSQAPHALNRRFGRHPSIVADIRLATTTSVRLARTS